MPILNIIRQDRYQVFYDLCRKFILIFIFVKSSDVKRAIRVIWAKNETHLSLKFHVVFLCVVMQRHHLTLAGTLTLKSRKLAKGWFKK